MLESDERLGYKKGEIYEVEPYSIDPCKLSAIKKVPDDGIYGKNGGFNVYRETRGDDWDWTEAHNEET